MNTGEKPKYCAGIPEIEFDLKSQTVVFDQLFPHRAPHRC